MSNTSDVRGNQRGSLRTRRNALAGFTVWEIMIGIGAITLLAVGTLVSAPEVFRRVRVASTLSTFKQCQDLFDGFTGETTFSTLPITEYGIPPGLTTVDEADGVRLEYALRATGLMKEFPKFAVSDGTVRPTPADANHYTYNVATRQFVAPGSNPPDWSSVGRMEVCIATGATLANVLTGNVGGQFYVDDDVEGIRTGQKVGFVTIPNVRQLDAELLAQKIDGERFNGRGVAQTRGKLIYPAPDANGRTRLYYFLGTD